MALPPEFDTVLVFDDYVDLMGNPAGGAVDFSPDEVLFAQSGPTILPVTVTAELDTAGHFQIRLPYSNDPQITGSNTYLVTFRLNGGTPSRQLRQQPAARRVSLDASAPGPLRLREVATLVEGTPADFSRATFGVDNAGQPFIETGV